VLFRLSTCANCCNRCANPLDLLLLCARRSYVTILAYRISFDTPGGATIMKLYQRTPRDVVSAPFPVSFVPSTKIISITMNHMRGSNLR